MGIGEFASKIIRNKDVQEKFRNAVLDKAIDKGADAFFNQTEQGFQGAKTKVKTTAESKSQDKKRFDEKYKRLSELVIKQDVTFEDYINGIEEAENMVKYFLNGINSLNMKNPTSLAKKQNLNSKLNKWKSLKNNLTKDVSLKMERECRLVFETKVKPTFFKDYPDIIDELLTCKTIQETNKLKSKLFKRYIDAFPTHFKYVDLFE